MIDSKSVKNSDLPSEKGYDAGKKVSGIKLHIATEIHGWPFAIHVTTADVTDRNGAKEMVAINIDSFSRIQKILVDGGYSGEKFATSIREMTGAIVEVSKRRTPHKFEPEYLRWIVERSFGWLDKCRRLAKNYERHLNTYKNMVAVAFIAVLLRHF